MNRRTFLCGLTVGTLAAPLVAEAQPARVPRIGYLGNGSPPPVLSELPFNRGLRELGWIEGQTVTIEYRWAEGKADQLPALADELVRAKVDVMVVAGGLGLRAGQRATSTIPIVFVILNDPVAVGLVKSFAHPGGNATGLASQFEELITKQLQLLKEAIPSISRIALLHHQLSVSTIILDAAEAAARRLGLTARTLKVAEPIEFENAFKTARSERAGAVHVLPSPFFDAHRHQLIELATRYRLPAMYEFKEYVRDGGLMSYGPSIVEMFRGMAGYVDRILRGAKAGDLPIERASKFQLVINLKTAKDLGLTIPQSVLLRADEVIQ
jgi:putative tryptophan/tyrosine transport system substrate-binding protein